MPARIGLYDDALIYDVLHAPGTREEVTGLERIARRTAALARRPVTHPVWLEPACGTGRYLRVAVQRGYRAIGFDLAPHMVEYARANVAAGARPGSPRARLFVAGMADFADRLRDRSVDFAFNLINTIRHVGTDRDMLAHFAGIAGVLKAHAVYAVGISLTDYGNEFPGEDVWQGARGSMRVKQILQYIPPPTPRRRFEEVHSHLVITRQGKEEHRDSAYRLRCYSQAQWLELIAKSPLRLVGVVDDEGRAYEPRHGGYAVYLLSPKLIRSGSSG